MVPVVLIKGPTKKDATNAVSWLSKVKILLLCLKISLLCVTGTTALYYSYYSYHSIVTKRGLHCQIAGLLAEPSAFRPSPMAQILSLDLEDKYPTYIHTFKIQSKTLFFHKAYSLGWVRWS